MSLTCLLGSPDFKDFDQGTTECTGRLWVSSSLFKWFVLGFLFVFGFLCFLFFFFFWLFWGGLFFVFVLWPRVWLYRTYISWLEHACMYVHVYARKALLYMEGCYIKAKVSCWLGQLLQSLCCSLKISPRRSIRLKGEIL